MEPQGNAQTATSVDFEYLDLNGRTWSYSCAGAILWCEVAKVSESTLGKVYFSNGISVSLSEKGQMLVVCFTNVAGILNHVISFPEFKFTDFNDALGRKWYCRWGSDGIIDVSCLPSGDHLINFIEPTTGMGDADTAFYLNNTGKIVEVLLGNIDDFLTAFLAYKTASCETDDI